GDKLEIKLIEVTRDGKFRLSRKALLPRPDGMPHEEHDSRPRQDNSHQGKRPDNRYSKPRR
nr:hypothetical protein [Candidatus Kapabacteria bacterium]